MNTKEQKSLYVTDALSLEPDLFIPLANLLFELHLVKSISEGKRAIKQNSVYIAQNKNTYYFRVGKPFRPVAKVILKEGERCLFPV